MNNRSERIRLIHRINDLLRDNHSKQLNTDDFDILYELDIDELLDTHNELLRQIKQYDNKLSSHKQ